MKNNSNLQIVSVQNYKQSTPHGNSYTKLHLQGRKLLTGIHDQAGLEDWFVSSCKPGSIMNSLSFNDSIFRDNVS